MADYIGIGFLLVIGIGIVAGICKVYHIVGEFSNIAFGTRYLMKGLKQQSDTLEKTPKSVSGMTKIFLPQIEKDFPEFNWVEFRQKTENMLVSYLSAVDSADSDLLNEASSELENQLMLRLEDGKKRGIREHYRNVQVHRTEITGYRRQQGTCVVTMQSAVGYYHYEEQADGALKSGVKDRMEQTKYNTELVYIQDVDKLNRQTSGVGVTCPNCGAPVKNLGSKSCEYCRSSIREISIRVWALNRLYEV